MKNVRYAQTETHRPRRKSTTQEHDEQERDARARHGSNMQNNRHEKKMNTVCLYLERRSDEKCARHTDRDFSSNPPLKVSINVMTNSSPHRKRPERAARTRGPNLNFIEEDPNTRPEHAARTLTSKRFRPEHAARKRCPKP